MQAVLVCHLKATTCPLSDMDVVNGRVISTTTMPWRRCYISSQTRRWSKSLLQHGVAFGLLAATPRWPRTSGRTGRGLRCQEPEKAEACRDDEELVQVPCLFYGFTRDEQGTERVSVVEVSSGERLMFIDRGEPILGEPVLAGVALATCLSYAFTWPNTNSQTCVRRSVVELEDGQRMTYEDPGAFAQSLFVPDSPLFLDDYVDIFAVLGLLGDLQGFHPDRRIGLVGLGAGTSARQLRRLLPKMRLLAFERSQMVLAAAAVMGRPLEDELLEVRLADIFSISAGPKEPLMLMAVDLAVDGGEFGDGQLPEELERKEAWLDLLSWRDTGGRVVANLGSLSRGLSPRAATVLRTLQEAAVAASLQVWVTQYPNGEEEVPAAGAPETDSADANLLALIAEEIPEREWDEVQQGRLRRPTRWKLCSKREALP